MTFTSDQWLRVLDLYSQYAACLDEGRFSDWPDFFTEDCHYRVVPRENYERELPLSTMEYKGRAMLLDRVYGVQSTLFHAPYYQRHILGLPKLNRGTEVLLEVEVNYLVLRTKRDQPTELLNTGRYIDTIIVDGAILKFRNKLCVFDSELIPNSLIYPI